MRPPSLYRTVYDLWYSSSEPLSGTHMKKIGALWRKSFKEITHFLQPFNRAPDLRKPVQTECQNSTPF